MTDSRAPTHIAYAMKREGRRYGRWLEVGQARQDSDGIIHVFLDRVPILGFNGYAYLAPIGAKPPLSEPDQPAPSHDDENA